jgi:hypothetical protein
LYFSYEDIWYPQLLGQTRVERGIPSLLILFNILMSSLLLGKYCDQFWS